MMVPMVLLAIPTLVAFILTPFVVKLFGLAD
jgi:pilus assembly protein TadC